MLIMGVLKSGFVGFDLNWNIEVIKYKIIFKVFNFIFIFGCGCIFFFFVVSWLNVYGLEEFLLFGKIVG